MPIISLRQQDSELLAEGQTHVSGTERRAWKQPHNAPK